MLVALGVVFVWNPGTGDSQPAAESARPPAAVDEDLITEDLTEVPVTEVPGAAPEQTAEPAEPPSATRPAPPETAVEGVDLQAIVDQELERREEELRQVFLEEEKRLLRELGTLAAEAPEGASEETDGGPPGTDR